MKVKRISAIDLWSGGDEALKLAHVYSLPQPQATDVLPLPVFTETFTSLVRYFSIMSLMYSPLSIPDR